MQILNSDASFLRHVLCHINEVWSWIVFYEVSGVSSHSVNSILETSTENHTIKQRHVLSDWSDCFQRLELIRTQLSGIPFSHSGLHLLLSSP